MKCHCKPFLIKVIVRSKTGLAYEYQKPVLLLIEPTRNLTFSEYFQLYNDWFPAIKSVLWLDDCIVPLETRVDLIFADKTFYFEKQPQL